MSKSVPWSLWEDLSKKAQARDTFFTDCGHSFWWIPYSIEYLLASKISLLECSDCTASVCTALDQFYAEIDVNYISKINPPPVKPVNKKAALVLTEWGVV